MSSGDIYEQTLAPTASGDTDQQIARYVAVSRDTAGEYRKNIRIEFAISNAVEAARIAARSGPAAFRLSIRVPAGGSQQEFQ
jgi:DNA-binding CsgD family transcriptional regulator